MSKFIDIVLRAKDLFSAKTDKAAESIGGLKTEIKSLDKELKDVEKTQDAINVFTELSEESKSLAQAVEQTQENLKKYAQQQAKASQAAEKAAQEHKELKTQVTALNSAYSKQNKALSDNGVSLLKAKTTMTSYEQAVKNAKQNIESTNTAYAKQKKIFTELSAQYKGSKAPLESLTDSYKNAKAQLSALEQTQKQQLTGLTKAEASYQKAADDVAVLVKSQKSYATSLEQTEKSLKENAAAQQKAASNQADSNNALAAASANYKAAAKAVQTLSTRLTKTNADLDKSNSKLKSAGVDVNNLASATEKLAAKQLKLTTATTKAFASLTTLTSKLKGVQGALSKVGSGISGFTGQLTALAGTYIGIRGITNSLTSFVNVGAKFEIFRKQFEGIMGSVAEGEQAFEWVKAFARETPLDMEQTTQAFIMLKGAGLDPMDGTLRALTDSTAKYTGSTAKLENITRQLSQAWAKGRINADDMRIAVDNGLPAWVLLEKATGKNVGELRKLSEQGRLGRYELKLLFAEMQSDAPNAAAKLMQTFSGQMAVAKFNMEEFLDTVAQSGALDFLTTKMTAFNEEVRAMAADGSLKVFAQDLSERFVEMASDISSAAKSLFTDLKGLTSSITSSFNVITIAVNIFTSGVRSLISVSAGAFEVLLLGMSKLHSAFGLLENPISRAEEKLSEFFRTLRTEALKQASTDAHEIKSSFEALTSSTEQTSKSVESLNNKVVTFHKAVEPLGGVLDYTAEQALEMANNIIKSGDSLNDAGLPADRLKATIEALIAKLREDPSPDVQAIVTKISAQYNKVSESTGKVEKSLQDLELSFKQLGGKTLEDLKNKVSETTQIFDAFKNAEKPITELRQAFTTLLEAEVELAKATGATLSTTLEATASQLGLSDAFTTSNAEVERNNALMNGTVEIYDRLINKQKNLQNVGSDSTRQTEKQKEAQEQLNKANAEAESHAGANAAFQKLWNEAKERSLRVYDLLGESTENLTKRTKELSTSLRDAFRTQSWSSIMAPINALNNLAKKNELQAIAQTKAYKQLFSALESGQVSLRNLNFYSENANRLFDKLSDTNLSALHAQIEAARAATEGLKDELSDTIHDLRNELDELEGDKASVLARDYQADKLELEQKLKEAQRTGDRQAISDAKESLSIARQIYSIRSKAIVSEQKEEIKTTKTVSESNNTNTNIKQTTQVQEINYKVTFAIGNNSSTFSSISGTNVEQLMTALAEAGFTVTRT